uniref:Uncharacterized protein n=2 Tax=Caenorhabditis japonica TaxID=281687 RepID=A0A8R1EPL8_CAEJA
SSSSSDANRTHANVIIMCALYQRLGSVCGSEVLSRIGFLSTLLLYLVDRAAASIAVTLRSSRNSTNVLASAMDRSHRVSMKNAACCVTYHELQTLRVRAAKWRLHHDIHDVFVQIASRRVYQRVDDENRTCHNIAVCRAGVDDVARPIAIVVCLHTTIYQEFDSHTTLTIAGSSCVLCVMCVSCLSQPELST